MDSEEEEVQKKAKKKRGAKKSKAQNKKPVFRPHRKPKPVGSPLEKLQGRTSGSKLITSLCYRAKQKKKWKWTRN